MRSLLFPVGFLWLLPQLFGNVGIYVAIPLAEMCTLVVASLIFAASRKHFADRKAHHGPERAAPGRKKSVAADCAGGTQWNMGLPQWRGSRGFLCHAA